MTTIPILETPRLRLRPHPIGDFADCVAMWADPAITRFTLGSPSTEQRTWMRLLAYPGLWALLKPAHGKGYATEGLLAATAWGDARFGTVRTFCIIQSGNVASIRVAEKIGFREIFRKAPEGESEIILARSPLGVDSMPWRFDAP